MRISLSLEAIEQRINTLTQRFMRIENGAVAPSCLPLLQAVRSQALLSNQGGKRLRARLCVAAYAWGVTQSAMALPLTSLTPPAPLVPLASDDAIPERMWDLACAIELFQTAALVHDDIIDESALRRGKASAYCALGAQTGSSSMGQGLGIMLGDLLASASVAAAHEAAAGQSCMTSAFLTMQKNVEIGQILDIAIEQAPLSQPEQLAEASLNVFVWKTASYTTIAPLELGLLAAGMSAQEAHQHAEAVGKPLGIAFQLADDLLDIIGERKHTGKPLGGDIREGKRTVLLADALRLADASSRAKLLGIYQQPTRSEADVRDAMAIFRHSGAIEASHMRIAQEWHDCEVALQALCANPYQSKQAQQLEQLDQHHQAKQHDQSASQARQTSETHEIALMSERRAEREAFLHSACQALIAS